ncbi:MAG TPA: Gfo/Idh/MocA family oxidoreductase [Actinomycetales bacterium]|jgi:myo-inositol 2-dehydrogenase/D-chiro-inositol 1-dehydrogenase
MVEPEVQRDDEGSRVSGPPAGALLKGSDAAPLRVGVVGLGRMGRTHVRVLTSLPGVQVAAVSDVDPGALADRGGAPGARAHEHPLELVRQGEVDALVVASSDASHADLVLAAIERGLPVLCEKPLTTSAELAHEIVGRERSLGRRLVTVGFMRRFDPAFAALSDAVRSGRLGAPAVVHTVHRNPLASYAFDTRVLVTNSASHDVDLVRWYTGAEITQVTCSVADGADDRFASVLLQLSTASGALAGTELTYGPGCSYDVRAEVVGREASMATPPAGTGGDWVDRFADAYLRQDAAWVAAVRAGTTTGASAWDGLANTVTLEAAGRALASGSPATVTLPDRPALYA